MHILFVRSISLAGSFPWQNFLHDWGCSRLEEACCSWRTSSFLSPCVAHIHFPFSVRWLRVHRCTTTLSCIVAPRPSFETTEPSDRSREVPRGRTPLPPPHHSILRGATNGRKRPIDLGNLDDGREASRRAQGGTSLRCVSRLRGIRGRNEWENNWCVKPSTAHSPQQLRCEGRRYRHGRDVEKDTWTYPCHFPDP